jgi:hypothetical protein
MRAAPTSIVITDSSTAGSAIVRIAGRVPRLRIFVTSHRVLLCSKYLSRTEISKAATAGRNTSARPRQFPNRNFSDAAWWNLRSAPVRRCRGKITRVCGRTPRNGPEAPALPFREMARNELASRGSSRARGLQDVRHTGSAIRHLGHHVIGGDGMRRDLA